MRWDERQVEMLRVMGIRIRQPEVERPAAEAPAAERSRFEASAAEGRRVEAPAAERFRVEAPAAGAGGVVPSDRPAAVSSAAADAPPRVVAPTFAAVDIDPAVASGLRVAAAARIDAGAPDPALRRHLAELDATALREAAAVCTACPLCEGRTRSVFDQGSGSAQGDWLVVGEPPVDAEDREGAPVVGKPGQLLDNMLRAVGIARGAELGLPSERACVTVPVKCRPPGNRAPTADEVATCEAYLVRQIALVRPKVVLALGRTASLLLRSDEPLGRLRGRVHRYRGLPLIASYAPAYLLRHPADKARAWDDLCLAREAAATG